MEADPAMQAKLRAVVAVQTETMGTKKVLPPSHLTLHSRKKWDSQFGPLTFTSGSG